MLKKNYLIKVLIVFALITLTSVKTNAKTNLPPSSYNLKGSAEIETIVNNAIKEAGDNETAKEEARKHTLKKLSAEQEIIKEHLKVLNDERKIVEERKENGALLTKSSGVYYFNGTQRETYYNLNMSGVVKIMRNAGFTEKEYPYWVREDGCKMLGDYIMVAANHSIYPRGSVIETSVGLALVCDTGAFIEKYPLGVDIAVTWK